MITYRPDFGLYWPDYDPRPTDTHNALMKRQHHADAVLPYVRGRSCVVQAGGHVGVWPLRLATHFGQVYTFEPDEACFRALVANQCDEERAHGRRIEARCAALRERSGVGFMIKGKCSSWRFSWLGDASAEIVDGKLGAIEPCAHSPPVAAQTIDSLNLEACDAIILDVEGSELEALRGAVATIAKFHPVIQLEEWYASRAVYLAYMRSIGYRPVAAAGADTVYVYEG